MYNSERERGWGLKSRRPNKEREIETSNYRDGKPSDQRVKGKSTKEWIQNEKESIHANEIYKTDIKYTL